MMISTVSSSSSSSGMIDDTNLVPGIENLSLSSSSSGMIDDTNLVPGIENLSLSSSSCVIDRVIGDVDLLTLILICLPVRSLLVFKSVSKQWLSIISDPIFAINNFRRLNPKTTGLFFETMNGGKNSYEVVYNFLLLDGSKFEQGHEGKEEVTKFEYGRHDGELITNTSILVKTPRRFDNDPEPDEYGDVWEFRVRISQSCNGLLCCNRQTKFDMDDDSQRDYTTYKTYIYNPTTRQYRCLPPSPFRDSVPKRDDCCIGVCSISLAFDPIKSMDQHYQVICIWKIDPYFHLYDYWDLDVQNRYYLEIYSSKTNSWRKLDSPSANPFRGLSASFYTSGVYWNGCLHWIASGRYVNAESSMYFDIDQELVKPLPASPNADESRVMYFGECGGHLYLVELLDSCYTHYNILKMEIDYSGWKHIHKLDLESLIDAYPRNNIWADGAFHDEQFIWRTILLLEEDEAETLSKLVLSVAGDEVISYDLKEKSVTVILTSREDFFFFPTAMCGFVWGHLHHYIESLAHV